MGAPPSRPSWTDNGLLLVVTGAVYALDRVTKAWIVANVEVGERIEVVGDLLQVWHTENAGAAFGLLQGGGPLFVIVSVLTLAVAAWVHLTGRLAGTAMALLLALVVGGTVGNLADRLAKGTVTDFLSIGIADLRWPTFNVADSAVVLGILALLVLLSVRERRATARPA